MKLQADWSMHKTINMFGDNNYARVSLNQSGTVLACHYMHRFHYTQIGRNIIPRT